jgi:DNA-binding NtrC family response regulator
VTAPGDDKPTVLVVDDEPAIRRFIKDVLAMRGYRCVTSQDAESAYELASRTGAAVAIVDLKLPGMSGAELAAKFGRELPRIATVAISGHLDQWNERDLRALGILRTLAKPFTVNGLVEAVEAALAERRGG